MSLFRGSKKKPSRRTTHRRRRLMAECLEGRRLLAGVVNLDTTTAGILSLEGDNSNNHVVVHGTAVPGQFVVTGENTLLRLDGGLQTFSTLTVNGIIDDILVDLDDGEDTFELGHEAGPSVVGRDVTIVNDDDDTNILVNVDIGDDLRISRTDTASSELQVSGSIIRDDLVLANNHGDTKTDIQGSEIEGLVRIGNGDGDDVTVIEGTTIGAAIFVRPDDPGIPVDPVVRISNGDGSSLTSFTQKNDGDTTGFLPTGTLGRPTIYGGVDIINGDPLPAGLIVAPPVAGGSTPDELKIAVDIVVFNETDVLGHLDLENFDGHTETVIVDSNIGTDTKRIDAVPVATSGYGEAVTVANGDGFDVTLVQASTMPYGFRLDNHVGANGTWGSQTDIRDSEIGGRDSDILGAGMALVFLGDNGDDVFNITDTTAAGTTIDGEMVLSLFNGDDSVQIIGLPGTVEIKSLTISGAAGDDSVYIENTEVESMVMITLASGVDTLELRDGVTFPGFVGTVLLDGGLGADFYHITTGIPWVGFEHFLP